MCRLNPTPGKRDPLHESRAETGDSGGCGYCRPGDLRWVSSRELMNLPYVGFKWAAQIRAVVRRFEKDASSATP
jgi:hypothetical protein